MHYIIQQLQTSSGPHRASPKEGSALRARTVQNDLTAKMGRGLRFAKFASGSLIKSKTW